MFPFFKIWQRNVLKKNLCEIKLMKTFSAFSFLIQEKNRWCVFKGHRQFYRQAQCFFRGSEIFGKVSKPPPWRCSGLIRSWAMTLILRTFLVFIHFIHPQIFFQSCADSLKCFSGMFVLECNGGLQRFTNPLYFLYSWRHLKDAHLDWLI